MEWCLPIKKALQQNDKRQGYNYQEQQVKYYLIIDPDFNKIPVNELISKEYGKKCSELIDQNRAARSYPSGFPESPNKCRKLRKTSHKLKLNYCLLNSVFQNHWNLGFPYY